jgi:hypothetical protein
MSADKMYLNEMLVDKMTADDIIMSADKITVNVMSLN